MLKLWGRVNSINVMKALWCLDELGIDYERADAGMEYGIVDDPAYRIMNPNGRVPVLQDGDFYLWESNVVVRYLSAIYGEGTLCPCDPKARALADQWMEWQHTTAVPDITFLFWGLIRNKTENQAPDLVSAATARVAETWLILDRHLDGKEIVMGDTFTMADIPLGACIWRYANLPLERPTMPNVDRWHESLKKRKGFQERVMLPLT